MGVGVGWWVHWYRFVEVGVGVLVVVAGIRWVWVFCGGGLSRFHGVGWD